MAFARRQNITATLEAVRQQVGCVTAWDSKLPHAENMPSSIHFKCGLTVDLPVSKKVLHFSFV